MSALTFETLSKELTQALYERSDIPPATTARCTLGRDKVMVLVEYPLDSARAEPMASQTLDWLEKQLRHQFDTTGLPEEAADLAESGGEVSVQLYLKHLSESKPFTMRSFIWKVDDGFDALFGQTQVLTQNSKPPHASPVSARSNGTNTNRTNGAIPGGAIAASSENLKPIFQRAPAATTHPVTASSATAPPDLALPFPEITPELARAEEEPVPAEIDDEHLQLELEPDIVLEPDLAIETDLGLTLDPELTPAVPATLHLKTDTLEAENLEAESLETADLGIEALETETLETESLETLETENIEDLETADSLGAEFDLPAIAPPAIAAPTADAMELEFELPAVEHPAIAAPSVEAGEAEFELPPVEHPAIAAANPDSIAAEFDLPTLEHPAIAVPSPDSGEAELELPSVELPAIAAPSSNASDSDFFNLTGLEDRSPSSTQPADADLAPDALADASASFTSAEDPTTDRAETDLFSFILPDNPDTTSAMPALGEGVLDGSRPPEDSQDLFDAGSQDATSQDATSQDATSQSERTFDLELDVAEELEPIGTLSLEAAGNDEIGDEEGDASIELTNIELTEEEGLAEGFLESEPLESELSDSAPLESDPLDSALLESDPLESELPDFELLEFAPAEPDLTEPELAEPAPLESELTAAELASSLLDDQLADDTLALNLDLTDSEVADDDSEIIPEIVLATTSETAANEIDFEAVESDLEDAEPIALDDVSSGEFPLLDDLPAEDLPVGIGSLDTDPDAVKVIDDDLDAYEYEKEIYNREEYENDPALYLAEETADEEGEPLEDVALVDDGEVQRQREQWQQQSKGNPWIFVGALGFAVVGVLGFVLTRPCTFTQCDRLQIAQTQGDEAIDSLSLDTSSAAVEAAKAQLNRSIDLLEPIPFWSRHHAEARAILPTYQEQVETLDRVSEAQTIAYRAAVNSQEPPHPVARWQGIAADWRAAAEALEQVPTDSPVREFAERKVAEYRANQATILVRIDAESKAEVHSRQAQQAASMGTKQAEAATSPEDWEAALVFWQSAVDNLKQIPQGTNAYGEAQKLLPDYEQKLDEVSDRAEQERQASRGLFQAKQLAADAQRDESDSQWTTAVENWTQALNRLEDIPTGSLAHSEAKALQGLYATALNKARDSQQVALRFQPVEAGFFLVCGSTSSQKCTYAVRGGSLRIDLFQGYDSIIDQSITPPNQRAATAPDAQLVSQSNQLLQQITLLSTQANIPVELYDARGDFLARYRPDLDGFVR